MKNEDVIKKINPMLIQDNGHLKPFTEQLLEYEFGLYPTSAPFVVSNITVNLNDAFVLPHPITINQSTINKVKKKHDISNAFIIKIESMIKNNVLVLESRNKKSKDSLVIVTDCIDKNDDPIVIILRKNYQIGYNVTNNISSIHARTNIKAFLEASFKDGCEFYPNEKTERWLSSQRLQLSPDVASALLYTNYDIPNKMFCQAETVFNRSNRGSGRHNSLEDQISYAKIRSSKRKVCSNPKKSYPERLRDD